VTAAATGIGSLPGTDMAAALRFVTAELSEFVHLPELPARGAPATMIGRTVALLQGLGADLQPAGWRLTDAAGADHRRAVSLLGQDLDLLEEHTQGYAGPLKIQVTGPWTLAATMERPRGDRVLADHGARRELAQSLAEGVAVHVADLARRIPGAELVVQVDEPGLQSVLGGRVPTASGFSRHRSVQAPVASAALQELTSAIQAAGARSVVHSCAADLPVTLLVESGFRVLSFDLSLASPTDDLADAFETGVDLWPGAVPAAQPVDPASERLLVDTVQRFFDALGHDVAQVSDRLVVTPACGLAGASPDWAREALRLTRVVAMAVSE
jgi:methionine synthase II (cobalamin-independent)